MPQHGHPLRFEETCPICQRDREIERLTALVDALRDHIADMSRTLASDRRTQEAKDDAWDDARYQEEQGEKPL